MNNDCLDQIIKSHFEKQAMPRLTSKFSVKLMENVYLEQMKMDRQKNFLNAMLIIFGLLIGWFIILSSIWQSGLIKEPMAWVLTQIHVLNVNFGWIKYPLIGLVIHAIGLRLLLGIPFFFKRKISL